MSGFPIRPSRAAFGPTLDHAPVVNNRKEIGPATYGLAWWQLAGAGVVVDQAWAIVDAAGLLLGSGECWDPNSLVLPVVTNPSLGVYEFEYPATAADENGVLQPVSFIGGYACAQGATQNRVGVVEIFNTRFARVRMSIGASAGMVATAFYVGLK